MGAARSSAWAMSVAWLLLAHFAPPARCETLGLGVALPLSGTNASFGRMQQNAYLMAAEAFNAKGGVRGMHLELEFRDTGGRTEATRAIMDTFSLNRAYPLVLGGLSSRDALEMARKAERLSVPVIVAGAAADQVTRPGSPLVFRIGPPLSRYPFAALSFAEEALSVQRCVLVAERTTFGDAIENEVRRVSTSRSWSPQATVRYEAAQPNLQPVIEAVAARSPSVVFLASFAPDAARIVHELRKRVPGAELVGLSPAFFGASFAEAAGGAEGVFAPVLWSPELSGREAEVFRVGYLERNGEEPDYHGAMAYAALAVAVDALDRSKDLAPESIRTSLAATRLDTVLGQVTFPSWEGYRNQNPAPTGLAQWQGGKARLVWPEDLRTATPVLGAARAARRDGIRADPGLLSP